MNYSIKEVKTLEKQHQHQLLELFTEADFAEFSEDTQWLADAVNNSVTAVAAFDESNRLIGFARALGDQVSDCYIQDVVIAQTYRGRNLGRKLMQSLIGELKKRNIDWIGLVAVPGKAGFYEKLGFRPAEGFVPMILTDE